MLLVLVLKVKLLGWLWREDNLGVIGLMEKEGVFDERQHGRRSEAMSERAREEPRFGFFCLIRCLDIVIG